MKTKKCTKHNIYFPDENESFSATEGYFSRNPYTSDGLDNWCRRCITAASSQKPPDKRIGGEWFELTDEDIEMIRKM